MAKRSKRKPNAEPAIGESELRIIGGSLRGSKLRYQHFGGEDDPVTRPMKHRVREAIFNLISTDPVGRHAIDLFAGTGALGIEALSRGSVTATFIERHVPTSRVIRENIDTLGLADRTHLLVTSAFLWARRDLPRWFETPVPGQLLTRDRPWLVFCSPPYAFYHQKLAEVLALLDAVLEHAPADSIVVVESDTKFDLNQLTGGVAESRKEKSAAWLAREYPPAVVAVRRS